MTSPELAWPTLPQLEALRAVAASGSFAAAADVLGCTQSAVSQRVAALERASGVVLLRRGTGRRQVRPTEAGRTLVTAAEQVRSVLDAATRQVRAIRDGADASISIGLFSSASMRIMPPVMAAIARQLAGYRIRLVERDDDLQLQDLLRRGEIDLTFVILPLAEGRHHGTELMRDPYVLLAPAGSAVAAGGRPVRAEDLADLDLVSLNSERREVGAELRRQGIEPKWVFETKDNHAVEELVAHDLGHAIVPRLALGQRAAGVRRLPLSDVLPPRVIGLAWRSQHRRSAELDQITRIIRQVCARPDRLFPPIDDPLPA